MIAKLITAYGKPTILACDAQCGLAWGIQNRPRVRFDDEDDYAFLSDIEALASTGPAPEDPGTYEGPDGKPVGDEDRLNRWCFRECERSVSTSGHGLIQLDDWSRRVYNQPGKHRDEREAEKPEPLPERMDHCHAGRDGECNWKACPQIRDNEPTATGRHCPLDVWREED